ncbi:energy-coupling factor transporter transmembrane component T [uncultured Methanoregula sp.]|uniref:energy-coupling factor transporter transmembrane component T family protein n=1 Tax=uncultured Methanoregula sp. TaxID=1005933 RepID=UPI002AAAD10A|nr:energy-coupling factor transporter transmembrane component T [uncultured Methanoregula sp.]
MAEILAYVHKDGIFHRLHPFTKIAFILLFGLVSILTTNLIILVAMVLVILLIAFLANLGKEVIQQFRLIAIMSIILIGITILTMPSGETIGYLIPQGIPFIGGALPVTIGAIEFGLMLTFRFMILICVFQLFVISTQPRDIVHTMERMHIPIDYTLMFLIALRFIPTLQIEGKRIHEAQVARGYNPGEGFMGKLRSVAPIVIPLVSNALSRATVLGLTIDIRGYRTGKKTRMREFLFQRRDYLAVSAIVVAGCGYAFLLIRQVI